MTADVSSSVGPFRVAVARFFHETCTFCPGGDPGVDDWIREAPPARGEEVLDVGAYMGGFVAQARDWGDIELKGLTSPRRVFGGTSRSWNQRAAFEHFVDGMLRDLREAMPVDGVYLALHGAMAVRDVERPEAEIARRFREVVGPDVPIVGSFDLHGNQDGEFLKWADGAFVTKDYPHYDEREQGARAARYLRELMRGKYRPATAVRRPPILTATVLQWTGHPVLRSVMDRARGWEEREPGAYVNVFLGFPWADVPTVGTSVHVMTNDDQELADRIADDVAGYLWSTRAEWSKGDFPAPDVAVRRAREAIASGRTPVLLADYADRPGDATWILRELVDGKVSRVLYAALTDEPALDAIWSADLRPGDSFDRHVGGYTGEQAGEPVRVSGTLAWRGRRWGYDRVAAIAFGNGNMLVLTPAYRQNRTPQQLRFGPIEPDDYDVIVVKSRVHFRKGFDDTGYAKTVIVVDAPGDFFGTVRLDALDYRNVDLREFYPFGDPSYHLRKSGHP